MDYSPTNGRLATLSGGALQAPSLSTFNYNYTANSNLLATVTGPAHTVTNDYDPDRNVLLTMTWGQTNYRYKFVKKHGLE